MCVVLCIIHQRSHYMVSVAPTEPHKSFPSLSLSFYMTLQNGLFQKGPEWSPEGLLGLPYVLLPLCFRSLALASVTDICICICRVLQGSYAQLTG